MSANEDTLARLTFNAAAMRDYIGEEAKGVRVKIERGVVTLRPAKTVRGVDVIAIERRPRGTLADIGRGVFPRRLIQSLFKAGLSETRPYFVLGTAGRGWLGIEHLPDQQPPPRHALMVVSDFDTPAKAPAKAPAKRASPGTIDLLLWQKFLRALTAERVIPEETWTAVYGMIQSAEEIAARKIRGRQSQERVAAERLLAGVVRHNDKLLAWAERQQEFADDVLALLPRLGVEMTIEGAEEPPEPEAALETQEAQELPEEAPEAAPPVEVRPRRPRRKSRAFMPAPEVVEAPPWIVTEEAVVIITTNDPVPEPELEAHGEGEDVKAVIEDLERQFADEQSGGEQPPDVALDEEDPKVREALDQAILSSWETHETLEPDISTERLVMLVQDDTGADGPRQFDAMQRAGWPLPEVD